MFFSPPGFLSGHTVLQLLFCSSLLGGLRVSIMFGNLIPAANDRLCEVLCRGGWRRVFGRRIRGQRIRRVDLRCRPVCLHVSGHIYCMENIGSEEGRSPRVGGVEGVGLRPKSFCGWRHAAGIRCICIDVDLNRLGLEQVSESASARARAWCCSKCDFGVRICPHANSICKLLVVECHVVAFALLTAALCSRFWSRLGWALLHLGSTTSLPICMQLSSPWKVFLLANIYLQVQDGALTIKGHIGPSK